MNVLYLPDRRREAVKKRRKERGKKRKEYGGRKDAPEPCQFPPGFGNEVNKRVLPSFMFSALNKMKPVPST